MIRFSLILALLTLSASIFAQKAHSVFIDNRVLNHYEEQISKLENLQKTLSSSEEKTDYSTIVELRKTTEKVAERGLSIYHQMASFLDKETLERLDAHYLADGVQTSELVYRNEQMRTQNPQMREILMTFSDLDLFLDNVSDIKNVSDNLQFNDDLKGLKAKSKSLEGLLASTEGITTILSQTN